MLNIEFSDDLFSLSLYHTFSLRKDDRKFITHGKDWNKEIVVHGDPGR